MARVELTYVLAALFPVKGFLGTGAPFAADLNLVMQFVIGAALTMGVILAKGKRYRAHGVCQTTALLVNAFMIGLVMWPSFRQQIEPAFPKGLHRWYYAVAAMHALLGITAEALGLYIVVVAGTNLLPEKLRFRNWRGWMRTEMMLWSIALATGVGTYYAWYVAPFA